MSTPATTSGAGSQPGTTNVAAIRQHAADIGANAARLEVLLLAIFDKLDEISRDDHNSRALDTVECFATCALRNGVLMREAADQVGALALEGRAG